jgi:hypothetical protein
MCPLVTTEPMEWAKQPASNHEPPDCSLATELLCSTLQLLGDPFRSIVLQVTTVSGVSLLIAPRDSLLSRLPW